MPLLVPHPLLHDSINRRRANKGNAFQNARRHISLGEGHPVDFECDTQLHCHGRLITTHLEDQTFGHESTETGATPVSAGGPLPPFLKRLQHLTYVSNVRTSLIPKQSTTVRNRTSHDTVSLNSCNSRREVQPFRIRLKTKTIITVYRVSTSTGGTASRTDDPATEPPMKPIIYISYVLPHGMLLHVQ